MRGTDRAVRPRPCLEVTLVAGQRDRGLERADVEHAAAFVAATDSDTTNLWLVESARRANEHVFVAAMQNGSANSSLQRAVRADVGMLPGVLVAHEVLARLANLLLMRFLPQLPRHGEEWSARMVARLSQLYRLLVAGRVSARRALDATLCSEPTAVYVVEGRVVPSSWVWRRLSGRLELPPPAR